MERLGNKVCPFCRLPTLEDTGHPGYRYGVGDFRTYVCSDCQFVAEFKITKKRQPMPFVKEERDYDY